MMQIQSLHNGPIGDFLKQALDIRSGVPAWTLRRLRGGLESEGVWRLHARYLTPDQRWRSVGCVVKRVPANRVREATIYRLVLASAAPGLSPALLGVQELDGLCHIFLETIRPASRWPWRLTDYSAQVLNALAAIHRLAPPSPHNQLWLAEWDYESELLQRARELPQAWEQNRSRPLRLLARKSLPALRRVISALPRIRRQLLGFDTLASTFIHGDVHPGNVLLRKTANGLSPVFLDWGRSRIGSPLEDVSSWLQSLGYWEPEARRRHDTLLMTYLKSRGESPRLTREFRDAYWLAAASNLLAGAMLHHLSIAVAQDSASPKKREAALRALADCLRVIRRADACWTAPAPPRVSSI